MILGLAIWGIKTAQASVISSTPDPLPPGSVFMSTSGGAGCFSAVDVCVMGGTLSNFTNIMSSFDLSGQVLDFSGRLTATLTDLSNKPLGAILFQGPISETIIGRTSSTELGAWVTQITSLDLTGMLGGNKLEVVQDADNPSLGQTTIARFGSKFQITSFFDIFVDINLDSVPPLTTGRGPLHVELVPMPEPASLALIVLPLIALAALRRYPTR
jgi:hypothetical protein